MRILYISSYYPLPTTNGARMRLWVLLRAMANAGHDVTLVSFAQPGETAGTEAQLGTVCVDYEIIPLALVRMADGGAYLRRLAAIFSPSPFLHSRFDSIEMRSCLERRLREETFDVVICDNVAAAVSLPNTSVPVVVNSCDVAHVLLMRYVEQERNPAKKLYAWLEAIKARRFEAKTFGRAQYGMACSNEDANALHKICPGLEIFVIPNVVDINEYDGTKGEEPDTVIFVGSMDSVPNRDAVSHFVRDILPLIQIEVPGVRFIAAGRNASPEFRASFSHVPAVQFTGTLPDIRPVIAKAAVSVVPLRIGSGTRIKILEGAAMGKAIVSTTLGAEGLDLEPDKEILIADDPRQFASCVTELLRNPERRKSLGEAARRRIAADYDLAALQRSIAFALESLEHNVASASQSV